MPSACFHQAEDGDGSGSHPDQNELDDFVDDGGEQAAERDIDPYGDGGNQNAEIDVPTDDDLHHHGHGEHVDAAHQDGHGSERYSGKQARAFAVAQLEISGHGVRFGHVVERDHHQAEKKHGGDGADPIPMRGQHAVLISGGRPAQQFQRAQVRGDEAQAGYPRAYAFTCEEEVVAGADAALQVHPDPQHQREV